MNQPRRAKRHAYLPGLAAFDPSHRRAATMEMGHQGANNEFQAGSIFVDTPEAQAHVMESYSVRHQAVLSRLLQGGMGDVQKRKLQREYRGLRSAMQNVYVIDPNAVAGNNQDAGPADVLFVKGHGNPRNPHSISTKVTPVSQSLELQPGVFEQPTTLRVKRGFKVTHTAQEVARSVHRIAAAVDSPGLDVRITSCGSGGTVSRDEVAVHARDLTQTFAGQVSHHLDQFQADARVQVSGYQGDSNSSLPRNQAGDGFVTSIKQRPGNIPHPERFFNAMDRQQAKLGPLNLATRQRERPLRDLQVGQQVRQQFPAPIMPPVSQALGQRVQAVTRITVGTDQEMQMVATGSRAAARVTVPRQ